MRELSSFEMDQLYRVSRAQSTKMDFIMDIIDGKRTTRNFNLLRSIEAVIGERLFLGPEEGERYDITKVSTMDMLQEQAQVRAKLLGREVMP